MYLPILKDSDKPLFLQLYQAIAEDCLRGRLLAGDKLPSRRKMARELRVSVNTVDSAYQQLVSEGYLESMPRSGFIVRKLYAGRELPMSSLHSPASTAPSTPSSSTPSQYSEPILSPALSEELSQGPFLTRLDDEFEPSVTGEPLIDFSPAGVDLSSLPTKEFKKLMRDVFSLPPELLFAPSPPTGTLVLRQSISRYLSRSRGLLCSPDQIVIGAGTDFILQYLVHLFDRLISVNSIAMENPLYSKAFQIFSALGKSVELIAVDRSGPDMTALDESMSNIVYVTPAHQFPLGTVMSAGRRAELLDWASRAPDRYIVEDDYDSEFRYAGRPVPPLSITGNKRVIYLGTFSKSVAPAMRVSYLVLPPHLAYTCHDKMDYFNNTVSMHDQLFLSALIDSGIYERHINRMRTLYRRKRDHLLKALQPFRNDIEIRGTDAGHHIICKIHRAYTEAQLVTHAFEKGVKVYGISSFYFEQDGVKPPTSTVLLGYAALSNEQISRGVSGLAEAWKL